MDPSSTTFGWKFLKSLSEKVLQQDLCKAKIHIDVRRTMFLQPKLSIALPLLNALSLHLQDTLGSNKCLLLAEGEMLSSVTTDDGDEGHFLKSLAVSDLNFFVKQLSNIKFDKNEEIFQKHSLKCEITMEYFRRHAITILQELCSESNRLTAPQKLAQFRKIISRVVETGKGSIWSDIQQGLDMVAYSVSIPSKSISLTYTPEWVKSEFGTPLKTSCSTSYKTLIGKSGKRYKVLKIKKQHKPHTSWTKTLKNLRTHVIGRSSQEHVECIYAIALFEEDINNELTQKELSKLIDFTSTKMYSISYFFR
ncbi:unnamed protein product [Strongylus vulgaris]|uniref:Uncharacterized protein n=1 Tax=Strongylus vulgaris TaxID=40348 RepID=A0A3P7LP87_STRVU|nr:unnamed protein product [Strongylus vulgaris]